MSFSIALLSDLFRFGFGQHYALHASTKSGSLPSRGKGEKSTEVQKNQCDKSRLNFLTIEASQHTPIV